MNRFFIHHPLFRLLAPLFSGTLVYLLILLINNTLGQVKDTFLGQELYVCIGLAYLIQECSRLTLLLFKRLRRPKSFFTKLLLQFMGSMLMSVILVTATMYLYFTAILQYSPNGRELLIFNSLFALIALIYVILYMSHQFLYKTNTALMAKEQRTAEYVEKDFLQFKRGINPELLFESLESIMVWMRHDPEAAETLCDHFSEVYRYLLSKKNHELVPIEEEYQIARQLVLLFDHLPYRKLHLGELKTSNTLIVPGSLIYLVEKIIRSTIPSEKQMLAIDFFEDATTIGVKYRSSETLRRTLTLEDLQEVSQKYQYYSTTAVQLYTKSFNKIIQLPKLYLDEDRNH
ncbi:MAG: histidine kinase [Bacteroidota bacterium]